MSYIGKNVAPQPQGTYSQSEIDTQMLTKSNSTDMTTAIALKANLASPTFTGTPLAPTASTGDSSTKLATTEFVNSEITNDVGVANSSLVKTALNASGSAPIYACRAWVNFNGTGTVVIRASGNVSSITDDGTGKYTVNFSAPMVDSHYAVALTAQYKDTNDDGNVPIVSEHKWTGRNRTQTSFPVFVGNWLMGGYNGVGMDVDVVTAAFFR